MVAAVRYARPWISRVQETEAAADGCPIESQDGLSLYLASTRAGALFGNDIWAADRANADRANKDVPFGAPVRLDSPVNSSANDLCPTPIDGSYLLFVSASRA